MRGPSNDSPQDTNSQKRGRAIHRLYLVEQLPQRKRLYKKAANHSTDLLQVPPCGDRAYPDPSIVPCGCSSRTGGCRHDTRIYCVGDGFASISATRYSSLYLREGTIPRIGGGLITRYLMWLRSV